MAFILWFLLSQAVAQHIVTVVPKSDDSRTGGVVWREKRSNGTNTVEWSAPDAIVTTQRYRWPADNPVGFLFHDGSGVTSWIASTFDPHWEFSGAGDFQPTLGSVVNVGSVTSPVETAIVRSVEAQLQNYVKVGSIVRASMSGGGIGVANSAGTTTWSVSSLTGDTAGRDFSGRNITLSGTASITGTASAGTLDFASDLKSGGVTRIDSSGQYFGTNLGLPASPFSSAYLLSGFAQTQFAVVNASSVTRAYMSGGGLGVANAAGTITFSVASITGDVTTSGTVNAGTVTANFVNSSNVATLSGGINFAGSLSQSGNTRIDASGQYFGNNLGLPATPFASAYLVSGFAQTQFAVINSSSITRAIMSGSGFIAFNTAGTETFRAAASNGTISVGGVAGITQTCASGSTIVVTGGIITSCF